MDGPTEPLGRPPSAASRSAASRLAPDSALAAEPVQRWRLTFAREPVDPERVGRAAVEAWQASLLGSSLAVARVGPGPDARARFALGAPLPASCAGRAELADIWLLERAPAWRVREALADRLPSAHRWVSAEDVWLGAPSLAAQVVAADWTVTLAAPAPDPARLEAAARALLAAPTLPRRRMKGGEERPYDLRPLLADVAVLASAAGGLQLRIRTRFDAALGAGRPEEVVAALAEAAGAAGGLEIDAIVRERLTLAEPAGSEPGGVERARANMPPVRPRR